MKRFLLPVPKTCMDAQSDNKRPKQSPEEDKSMTGGLSALEQLPAELAWEIIEYVPGSVFSLRTASKMLKLRVEEFAMLRPNKQVIQKIVFVEWLFENAEYVSGLSFIVAKSDSYLFAIRLLRNAPFDVFGIMSRKEFLNETRYFFRQRGFMDEELNYLKECIGRRIGKIVIRNCDVRKRFAFFFKLIEGTIKCLLTKIKECEVNEVRLLVSKFEMRYPEKFLLDLSSTVSTIEIEQLRVAQLELTENYCFGLYYRDWASIIIKMFSRKMSKLRITNEQFPEFIHFTGAEALMENLPNFGKNIWFEATHKNRNFQYTTRNEYKVKFFDNPCPGPIQMPPQSCSPMGDTCGGTAWCHLGATPETTICCPNEGDPCSLPMSRGSGNAQLDRWYYNAQTANCQPFTYTGMRGNANNFLNREACEQRCGPNPCFEGQPYRAADGRPQTCSATTGVCNLPMSTGEGNANLERFYFDAQTRTCRAFIYNGLKGNQNNFVSLRSCQLACQPFDNPCIGQPAVTAAGQVLFCSSTNKDACPVNFWCHLGATPETTVCCPGATNACSVPLAPGTGNNGLSRWYYNPDDRECVPFQYNGKRGNQNNFETQSECMRTCPEQLCLLSIDRGACGGRQTRYAFNRQTNQCIAFEYTGCGGNLNNFASMADCAATCGNIGF